MFRSQPYGKQFVAHGAWEGNMHGAAVMNMPGLGARETEIIAAETSRMQRYSGPGLNFTRDARYPFVCFFTAGH